MASSGLPLPLRNALAELAIAALEDDVAVAALEWLAVRATAPPPADAANRLAAAHLVDPGDRVLLPVHTPHTVAVCGHAARALAAARAYRPPAAGADAVVRALRQAAALWDQRLFFEVHEVLEAVWRTAAGDRRPALQGVIQIAVAFHHLAHGNVRGARTLMREGRARLAAAAGALTALDAGALLAATAPWEDALAPGGHPPPDAPPALALAD